MTGKDFSGPTPVIRAPTPLTLNQPENANEAESNSLIQTQSGFQAMDDSMHEEIIVGDAESFEQEL